MGLKTTQTQFVKFKLLHMPCCQTQICWVNHRLPNYCPECGTKCLAKLRLEPERILVQDEDARLVVHY